jgi:RNA polymerase sigma-70 factor (ECF subfamily)
MRFYSNLSAEVHRIVESELVVAYAGRSSAEELVSYVVEGQKRWPAIVLPREDAFAHLARSLEDGRLPPREHAGDWFLACACTLGRPDALNAFCATFSDVIARVARRRTRDDHQSDDLSQNLLEKLVLGSRTERPKIAQYEGRGPLRAWVAAAAATLALTAQRALSRRRKNEGRAVEDQRVMARLVADPAHALFQQSHREQLGEAIREALAGLSPRDKTLLRLHVGQGMTIDHLAAVYGVNRATAARWLVGAREQVAEEARLRLKAKVDLTDTDVSSLLALISNIMEISVLRHLGP